MTSDTKIRFKRARFCGGASGFACVIGNRYLAGIQQEARDRWLVFSPAEQKVLVVTETCRDAKDYVRRRFRVSA